MKWNKLKGNISLWFVVKYCWIRTGNKSEQLNSNPNSLYNSTASLSQKKNHIFQTILEIGTSFCLAIIKWELRRIKNISIQQVHLGRWRPDWSVFMMSFIQLSSPDSPTRMVRIKFFHSSGSRGPSWVWSEHYAGFILTGLWQHFAIVNTMDLDLHSENTPGSCQTLNQKERRNRNMRKENSISSSFIWSY